MKELPEEMKENSQEINPSGKRQFSKSKARVFPWQGWLNTEDRLQLSERNGKRSLCCKGQMTALDSKVPDVWPTSQAGA